MKIGQLVKVTEGPLKGSLARVQAYTDKSYKIAGTLDSDSGFWVLKEYVEVER